MRILHLNAGLALDWGGPSRVVREMAEHLARRGHDVTVMGGDVAPGRTRARLGDPNQPAGVGYTIRLYRTDLLGPPYPSVALLADLVRSAGSYDVAHVHGLFNAPMTSAMWVLRARGVPYVVRPCGMLDAYSLREREKVKSLYYRVIERANLEHAAAIQVSTAHEEDAVRALGLKTPIERLPQGVEHVPVVIRPSPWPRPYILALGRVAKKKGLSLLIEATRDLDVDVVLVGPDELGHGAELDRIAHARVHRVGPERDPSKKATWYAHAAVVALLSEDENFGIVVIEAAQQGAPLVVSDQVGLAPDVAETGAGLVVPRDPAAVRAALATALARPRAPARARALSERFAWEPLAERLEALYRRIT